MTGTFRDRIRESAERAERAAERTARAHERAAEEHERHADVAEEIVGNLEEAHRASEAALLTHKSVEHDRAAAARERKVQRDLS